MFLFSESVQSWLRKLCRQCTNGGKIIERGKAKQIQEAAMATRYIHILAVTSKQKSQGTILLKLEPPFASWFSICLDFIKNQEADRSTDFDEIGQGPKLTMGKNVTCFLYSNPSL